MPTCLILPLTPDRLKLYCYNRVEELYAEHKTATTERRELIFGGMEELRALALAVEAAEKGEVCGG
jgi:predicted DNA-binding protein